MFSSKPSTSSLTVALFMVLGMFSQPSHAGYQLMDDCTDDQKSLLNDAFSKIRDMIANAQPYNTASASDNGKQLFQSLYGEQPGSGQMSGSVDLILRGVLLNASPTQGDATGTDDTNGDVQVYCTDNRFIKKTNSEGKKRRWDPAVEEWVDKDECDLRKEVAYAIVPTDKSKPDTIQVCNWYMEYLLSIDPKFQSKWDKNIFTKAAKNIGVKWMEHKYTPVDLFALAEKTLIHELTHTRHGQQLDDPRQYDSYGWKNCREMSTIRSSKEAPNHNADTFALWVSCCQIIQDGGSIGEDGKLTLPQTSSRRGFEVDIAMLKARALV